MAIKMSLREQLIKGYTENIDIFSRQIIYGLILGFLPVYTLYLSYKVNMYFKLFKLTREQIEGIMVRFIPNQIIFFFLLGITFIFYFSLSRKKNRNALENEISSSLAGKIVTIFQVLSGNVLATGVMLSMESGDIMQLLLLIYFLAYAVMSCIADKVAQSMKMCNINQLSDCD